MAFKHTNSKGKTYYLHGKTTKTASGSRTLYFFSGEQKEGVLDAVPEGYTVSETGTGLPVLKKSGADDKAGSSSTAGSKSKAAAKK